MNSYLSFEGVLADLGDKVVAALSKAASLACADLAEYRRDQPVWVADSTERGLANWIHDRLWVHLVSELSDVQEAQVVDREPLREIYIGLRYRVRVKRHHQNGAVSSYPTLAARTFFMQPQPTLEGLEEVHLCAGYDWDRETREIGAAVLSLRDGHDKIIWCYELPTLLASTSVVPLTSPAMSGPVAPRIEVGGAANEEASDQEVEDSA